MRRDLFADWAAKIAVANPAAPPPMIAIVGVWFTSILPSGVLRIGIGDLVFVLQRRRLRDRG